MPQSAVEQYDVYDVLLYAKDRGKITANRQAHHLQYCLVKFPLHHDKSRVNSLHLFPLHKQYKRQRQEYELQYQDNSYQD